MTRRTQKPAQINYTPLVGVIIFIVTLAFVMMTLDGVFGDAFRRGFLAFYGVKS